MFVFKEQVYEIKEVYAYLSGTHSKKKKRVLFSKVKKKKTNQNLNQDIVSFHLPHSTGQMQI